MQVIAIDSLKSNVLIPFIFGIKHNTIFIEVRIASPTIISKQMDTP